MHRLHICLLYAQIAIDMLGLTISIVMGYDVLLSIKHVCVLCFGTCSKKHAGGWLTGF